jgi:hypothetical protein
MRQSSFRPLRFDEKKIQRPSCDQMGRASSPGSFVSWRTAPPLAETVKISELPAGLASNTTSRPSGDHLADPGMGPPN